MTLILGLWLTSCLGPAPTDTDARTAIAGEGLEPTTLTRGAAGTFDFVATDPDGRACTGTVALRPNDGGFASTVSKECYDGHIGDSGWDARRRAACDRGSVIACEALAEGLATFEASAAEARLLFAGVCDHGLAGGCTNLAIAYRTGVGGTVDEARSLAYYARACELYDDYAACDEAGKMAAQGIGGPVDLEAAAKYARIGCDAKPGDLCGGYAHLVRKGVGGDVPAGTARAYADKGCVAGSRDSCAERDDIDATSR